MDAAFRFDGRLRKAERLRRRAEYLRVQRHGRKYANRFVLIFSMDASVPWTRLGVTVSKKVGNSVVRSRVKRLIREAFRLEKQAWPPATDIVVVARQALATADLDVVQAELRQWARWYQRQRQRPPEAP